MVWEKVDTIWIVVFIYMPIFTQIYKAMIVVGFMPM